MTLKFKLIFTRKMCVQRHLILFVIDIKKLIKNNTKNKKSLPSDADA